ncbi:hypothetical protein [Thermosulfurimonas sp.]|uniref:hypothetical protein n=1 Tax=Thermosulfurimonas sp. TaxID=2080236 RepID=UPI0025E97A11|nr:hypothetical protein [Thermosulfurimonas sp.]
MKKGARVFNWVWSGVLVLLLGWRIGDFVGEFMAGNYHMTLRHFILRGRPAEILQLLIILALAGLLKCSMRGIRM